MKIKLIPESSAFTDELGRPIVLVNTATFPHRVMWFFIGLCVGYALGGIFG